MNPIDRQKQASAAAAALEIEDGMTVGLGTGSTAAHFVTALAQRSCGRSWSGNPPAAAS